VFAPLKETVPVFKTPFRLVRDLVFQQLPPAAAGRDTAQAPITLAGRVEYQASDDHVCFNPVSLPVSWTFTAGTLDRERSTVVRRP
jgi:hypothetical protein